LTPRLSHGISTVHAPRPRRLVPEIIMDCHRLTTGRSVVSMAAVAAGALMIVGILSVGFARAAEEFPFDRVLLLDVAPMRPLKRVPILTVQENGSATIELWCRTANARVEISGEAIRIETAPLPEALPLYMSSGQCSDARVQADNEMLEALSQVTEWRRRGDGVVLIGPTQMPFRASSH
jgi:heat shock protein HslJ